MAVNSLFSIRHRIPCYVYGSGAKLGGRPFCAMQI